MDGDTLVNTGVVAWPEFDPAWSAVGEDAAQGAPLGE